MMKKIGKYAFVFILLFLIAYTFHGGINKLPHLDNGMALNAILDTVIVLGVLYVAKKWEMRKKHSKSSTPQEHIER